MEKKQIKKKRNQSKHNKYFQKELYINEKQEKKKKRIKKKKTLIPLTYYLIEFLFLSEKCLVYASVQLHHTASTDCRFINRNYATIS